MNFALLLISAVLGTVTIGSVMIVLGLRNAPEGFEDENGFSYGRPVKATSLEAAPDFAACLEQELTYAGR